MLNLQVGQGVEAIFSLYGWVNPSVQEMDEGMWKVTCNEGTFIVKRSHVPREKLLLVHRILKQLHTSCPHLLPWVKTQEGSVVATLGGVNWYAMPWTEKRLTSKEPKKEVMRALARLHREAASVVTSYPELYSSFSFRHLTQWKDAKKRLLEYQKLRKAREFLSPFDKSLKENEESLGGAFHFVTKGMEKFLEANTAPPRYTLCLQQLRSRDIAQDQENLYFTHFDDVQVKSPVHDLSVILHALTRDSRDSKEAFAYLEAYESEFELLPKEKKLLALYLSYPGYIMKTIDQYYDNPDSLNGELSAVRRLDQEIAHMEALQDFVKSLWTTKTEVKVPTKVASKVPSKAPAKKKAVQKPRPRVGASRVGAASVASVSSKNIRNKEKRSE